MSTSWIRDKVVAVAEAQAEDSGESVNEIIWQLSKELGKIVQISPTPEESALTSATARSLEVEMVALSVTEGFDSVSRPAHYTEGREYEPKDVIRDWGLNFNIGSAVKYCSRAGKKGDAIEDLDKAITFLTFEREALLRERNGGSQES